MKHYRIQGRPVQLSPGSQVELTRAQAEPRLHILEGHALKNHGKNGDRLVVYTLLAAAFFKVGETVGWDGEVPKAWADIMIDLDAAREAEEAAARQAVEENAAREAQKQAAARQAVEENAAREAQKQAAARAKQEHQALVAALKDVQADDGGNVSAEKISQALAAAKLNFEPTHAQAEAAWTEVFDARLKIV